MESNVWFCRRLERNMLPFNYFVFDIEFVITNQYFFRALMTCCLLIQQHAVGECKCSQCLTDFTWILHDFIIISCAMRIDDYWCYLQMMHKKSIYITARPDIQKIWIFVHCMAAESSNKICTHGFLYRIRHQTFNSSIGGNFRN